MNVSHKSSLRSLLLIIWLRYLVVGSIASLAILAISKLHFWKVRPSTNLWTVVQNVFAFVGFARISVKLHTVHHQLPSDRCIWIMTTSHSCGLSISIISIPKTARRPCQSSTGESGAKWRIWQAAAELHPRQRTAKPDTVSLSQQKTQNH